MAKSVKPLVILAIGALVLPGIAEIALNEIVQADAGNTQHTLATASRYALDIAEAFVTEFEKRHGLIDALADEQE